MLAYRDSHVWVPMNRSKLLFNPGRKEREGGKKGGREGGRDDVWRGREREREREKEKEKEKEKERERERDGGREERMRGKEGERGEQPLTCLHQPPKQLSNQ